MEKSVSYKFVLQKKCLSRHFIKKKCSSPHEFDHLPIQRVHPLYYYEKSFLSFLNSFYFPLTGSEISWITIDYNQFSCSKTFPLQSIKIMKPRSHFENTQSIKIYCNLLFFEKKKSNKIHMKSIITEYIGL